MRPFWLVPGVADSATGRWHIREQVMHSICVDTLMPYDYRIDDLQNGRRYSRGTLVSSPHKEGGFYRTDQKKTVQTHNPPRRQGQEVGPWLRGEICSKIANLCLHPERQFHGTGVSQKIKRQDAAPQLGRRQNLDQLGRGTFGEIRIRRAA